MNNSLPFKYLLRMIHPSLRLPGVLLSLLICTPLCAQDSTAAHDRLAIVKTNLLGPFSLFVEARAAERKRVQVSV